MRSPDAKRHFIISLAKSLIRIISCCFSIIFKNWGPIAIGFILAEALGVLEELT